MTSYLYLGLVIRTFDPHVYVRLISHRGRSEWAESSNEGPGMFKSQQYRAKAAEYDELIKRSTSPDEIRKFQELKDRLASLADNEQGLADDYDNATRTL